MGSVLTAQIGTKLRKIRNEKAARRFICRFQSIETIGGLGAQRFPIGVIVARFDDTEVYHGEQGSCCVWAL
jgi:hypothetical protein